MHNFNVTLSDGIVVPNTGASTHHDSGVITTSIIATIIVVAVLIILAILFAAIIAKKRKLSHKVFDHQAKFLKSKSLAMPLALIFAFSAFASFIVNYEKSNPDLVSAAPNNQNALAITASDINLEAELVKGEAVFKYVPASVKVAASSYGYILSAYTDSTKLVNKDLPSNTTSFISSVTTNNTTLSENSWGIALTEPTDNTSSVWRPLSSTSTRPTTLKDVSVATPADDETTIYYGINVNDELELGTYSTTIVYTAVAKVVPCSANSICYDDNGANSPTTMGEQAFAETDTEITLWASNFQYLDHGFAGWNTKPDGTGINYGPNETIAISAGQYATSGLWLYANWVKSEGDLQSWDGCETMNIGDVTALKDARDNNTYAVAKLADGKCWMIENLQLDNTAALTTANTNNPLNNGTDVTLKNTDGTTTNHLSASTNPTTTAWCFSYNPACYDQSMLYTGNTTNPATNMSQATGQNIYSYGNYYNWYSATAGRGTYSFSTDNSSVTGDICPAGWHLPKGGRKGNVENSEFWKLSRAVIGYDPANFADDYFYYTGSTEGVDASNKLRGYPNNFVYSGYVGDSTVHNQGSLGRYWSSTASGSGSAYSLVFNSSGVNPGTNYSSSKSYGFMARCVADETYNITYDGNGNTSSFGMDKQVGVTHKPETTLWAANYAKDGYGFAGWSLEKINPDDPNFQTQLSDAKSSGKVFGPNETVAMNDVKDKTLYAIWVKSADDLQNWGGCASLNIGDVTALKDARDNNTYAVAKLADGKCWMIENLRLGGTTAMPLDSATTNIADGTTFTLSASTDHTATAWCRNDDSSCVDQSMLYSGSVDNAISSMANPDSNVYSYGNYYNWYSATAGNGTFSTTPGNVNGDICPVGWHVPTGGTGEEIYNLNRFANAGLTDTDEGLRRFPTNLIYSGIVGSGDGSAFDSRGQAGLYWTSTSGQNRIHSYALRFNSSNVRQGTHVYHRWYGFSIRCLAD